MGKYMNKEKVQPIKESEYLGNIIKTLRIKRGLTQEFIRKGLCGKSQISDIENGNKIPEKILFEALLERMGYSADKLGLLISSSEYEICIFRGLIEDQMMLSNWQQARQYLEEYKSLFQKKNVLHKQYSLMVEAVLVDEQDQNEKEAVDLLWEALIKIYPDFHLDKINEYALSGTDLRSILGIMELKSRQGKRYTTGEIKQIEEFIEDRVLDEDLLAKVYTQFAYVAAKSLLENNEWELAKKITKKGISFLVAEGGIALLCELLSYNIRALQALGNKEQALEREKERKSLIYTYKYFGVKITDSLSNLLFPICKEDLILSNEVIYKERITRKMTSQRMETEGVNATSLCKIERGKRTPRSSTYDEIMKILGANSYQYDSWVDTSEYEMHLKVKKVIRKIQSLDQKSLEKMLGELELELDMNLRKNKQFIEGNKTVLQMQQKKIGPEKALDKTQKLLALSRKNLLKGSLYGATRLELMLIMMMALYNHEIGKFNCALNIYQSIIEAYEDSKLSMRNKMLRLIPVYANLSNLYELMDEIPKAIETARKGAQLLVSCKSGNLLGRFMATIGMSENCLDKKYNCVDENLFIHSYYLNKLMGQQVYADIIDDYFQKNYGKKISEIE